MEKGNTQLEDRQPMEQTKACFARANQVWLTVNHNTTLANYFHVRSVLHGQVSLAAVNYEAMNDYKSVKIH